MEFPYVSGSHLRYLITLLWWSLPPLARAMFLHSFWWSRPFWDTLVRCFTWHFFYQDYVVVKGCWEGEHKGTYHFHYVSRHLPSAWPGIVRLLYSKTPLCPLCVQDSFCNRHHALCTEWPLRLLLCLEECAGASKGHIQAMTPTELGRAASQSRRHTPKQAENKKSCF